MSTASNVSPTLDEIAREVGVSSMSVSATLRGVGRISSKTRQRIWDTARRMGYLENKGILIPSPVRGQAVTDWLRVLAPTISAAPGDMAQKYHEQMLGGLQDATHDHVQVRHYEHIDDLIDSWHTLHCDGIALRLPLPTSWLRRLQRLAPVVYAMEYDYQESVDCVYSNEHRSAMTILQRLAAAGHHEIAWLGVLDFNAPWQLVDYEKKADTLLDLPATSSSNAGRHAAWANLALCQGEGRGQPLVLVSRNWEHQGLSEVVAEGLDRILAQSAHRPTAIVCSCDIVAHTLIEQLQDRNLTVPDDISIVSYGGPPSDNESLADLSSVQMPQEILGRVVPELIQRRLSDPDAVPVSLQFETTWHEGETLASLT